MRLSRAGVSYMAIYIRIHIHIHIDIYLINPGEGPYPNYLTYVS